MILCGNVFPELRKLGISLRRINPLVEKYSLYDVDILFLALDGRLKFAKRTFQLIGAWERLYLITFRQVDADAVGILITILNWYVLCPFCFLVKRYECPVEDIDRDEQTFPCPVAVLLGVDGIGNIQLGFLAL